MSERFAEPDKASLTAHGHQQAFPLGRCSLPWFIQYCGSSVS